MVRHVRFIDAYLLSPRTPEASIFCPAVLLLSLVVYLSGNLELGFRGLER